MKMIYNCAQEPGELVADALELGHKLTLDAPEKDGLCAVFAARYGLLGLEQGKDTTPSGEAGFQPSSRIGSNGSLLSSEIQSNSGSCMDIRYNETAEKTDAEHTGTTVQ